MMYMNIAEEQCEPIVDSFFFRLSLLKENEAENKQKTGKCTQKSHVEKNWKRPSTAGGPLLLFLFQSLFPFFNRFFYIFHSHSSHTLVV